MSSSRNADHGAPLRDCGDCSLCCKVMEIATLGKPPGSWCGHCKPTSGCAVYGEHPEECRQFNCLYLISGRIGEEWKPSRSRIVLVTDQGGDRIIAHVDPTHPDAWKRRPYYQQLKDWAARSVSFRGQVIAAVGRRMYMILPDRDVDLGVVGLDEFIVVNEIPTPSGIRRDAVKVARDDPRAQRYRTDLSEGAKT